MTWVDDTLSEFGRSLGLPGLVLDANGVAHMALGPGGVLGIQAVVRGDCNEIIVFMGRPVGPGQDGLLHRALSHALFRTTVPFAVQVALRGTGTDTLLLAAIRLPDRQFTPNRLAHAVEFLTHWLDKALTEGSCDA